jgi:hypothetical protein
MLECQPLCQAFIFLHAPRLEYRFRPAEDDDSTSIASIRPQDAADVDIAGTSFGLNDGTNRRLSHPLAPRVVP